MALFTRSNLARIRLLTRVVPRPLIPPLAVAAGLASYLLFGRQRRAVRANLRVVMGRRAVERLVVSTFCKYALNWCDVVLMARLRGPRLQALIGDRSDPRPLEEALENGTGAILASLHLGNWELGGLGLADLGYPVNVVTYREPDAGVAEERRRMREERGVGVLYVGPDGRSPHATLGTLAALRRNELVCIVADRDGSSRTVEVDLCGRPTRLPSGPAHLALASGAPLIPVFVVLRNGRYTTLVDEPIHLRREEGPTEEVVRAGLQRLADSFSRTLRAYPDQWYNFYDFWGSGAAGPDAPPAERGAAAPSRGRGGAGTPARAGTVAERWS